MFIDVSIIIINYVLLLMREILTQYLHFGNKKVPNRLISIVIIIF